MASFCITKPQSTSESAPATNSAPTSSEPPTPAEASTSGKDQLISPDMEKLKCKKFLGFLLWRDSVRPAGVEKNVRALIQGLLDGTIDPEEFSKRLQLEMNFPPMPYVAPFLKKHLTYLHSGELTIDAIASQHRTVQPDLDRALIQSLHDLSGSPRPSLEQGQDCR